MSLSGPVHRRPGYKVQSIVDPDTAVPVGVGTIDGKFGAFQEKGADLRRGN